MVQAEVAERLAAEPGGKDYGVPSAKIRFYGKVRRHGMVSPTVFWPIPRVYSGLVRIDRYETTPWPTDTGFRQQVFNLIDIAFAQRRKTSRNAFAEWAGSGNESARRLLAASIDPSRRGETLSIADFVRLLERSGVWDPRAKRLIEPVETPRPGVAQRAGELFDSSVQESYRLSGILANARCSHRVEKPGHPGDLARVARHGPIEMSIDEFHPCLGPENGGAPSSSSTAVHANAY